VLDADRVPTRDAWIVARLKQAGAVIMGKTATAELAFAHPAATRNPRAPSHTPGGSSSGSAAAVADRMAPLAIGTQTAGSVIRPAAFCGIVGFKPSFGAIPRTGILRQSPNLDTVGVFAADLAGAALLAEALFGHDAADAATAPAPAPGLLEAARAEPAETPAFGFVKGPAWESADDETKDAFAALAGSLAGRCEQVALPDVFAEALAARESINFVEMARNYHRYVDQGRDRLGPQTIEAIARGETISDRDYAAALELPAVLNAALERLFARFDAILTPAAPGPAPAGLASTGSPAFNGLWTLCGTPAITIPALEAANGLPMGVQLVGPRPGDARLLRTANWLVRYLAPPQQGGEATP